MPEIQDILQTETILSTTDGLRRESAVMTAGLTTAIMIEGIMTAEVTETITERTIARIIAKTIARITKSAIREITTTEKITGAGAVFTEGSFLRQNSPTQFSIKLD